MKVMKFGGGCLRDNDHFMRASEIIISEEEKTLVVVSAVSGMTDTLTEAILIALESEKNVPGLIKTIEQRHNHITEDLFRALASRRAVNESIKAKIKKLERLLYGISYTEETTSSLKAHILSYGERLSAIILSALINELGRKSLPLEADEIGMITDDCYEGATALLPEMKKNLVLNVFPHVDNGIIPVITGYFGQTKEGKVTTFGRNGSDYSAAVIANVLDASLLEIWKDVDGFMSADPKIVQQAKNIDRLSYYEAAELSYFGAKILDPRAVEPLMEKNIPLAIKNFYEPLRTGTLIQNGSVEHKNIIKSITYNKNISFLRIHGPGVGSRPGIIAEIGHTLLAKGINIYSVITSQTCINLLLDRKDSRASFAALQKLEGGLIENIALEENIALVGVVGKGLSKGRGVAARVFSAVAKEKINVEMISSGASEVAYYFVVCEKDLENTIRVVHRAFFDESSFSPTRSKDEGSIPISLTDDADELSY